MAEPSDPTASDPLRVSELHEKLDRLCGLTAQIVVTERKAYVQTANERLQHQATLNQILAASNQLLSIVLTPEGLAGMATQGLLDQARQVKRKTITALTGKDPASERKRDDEITLVSVPRIRGSGAPHKLRVNKRFARLLWVFFGLFLYWFAKRLGVPLHAIE